MVRVRSPATRLIEEVNHRTNLSAGRRCIPEATQVILRRLDADSYVTPTDEEQEQK